MYYFELGEFVARRDGLVGETLRVKGWVKQGSVSWDAHTNELAFELATKDGGSPVPVAYRGIRPDMFSEGREVVVEGRYQQGGLAARQIMTSCPSKYEPAVAGGGEARAGSWTMPEVGRLAVCLALLFAAYGVLAGVAGRPRRRAPLGPSAPLAASPPLRAV